MTTTAAARLGAPAAVAAGVVAAGALLFVRDPRTSTYLPCPLHAMTGLWCPGCGATRAFGDLVRGDVASALSSNALAVVLLCVGAIVWAIWARARLRGRTFRKPASGVVVVGIVIVLVFTVFRNLPVGSWLAPS
ncbi:DUF2752 domain-containing protein [Rhodococcus sp. P1Y]|uniref:DUF2752 domain-containing protein n=1 Tax=Rhodococcus sp. P1Y TaxID=1302308 RepID=UPI000EAD23BD|nr:DUF2752 domain-containing protein [Rhodococcus sp. P1Y]AYJ47033.1 DUF2752 domain-containing protein [Rhodococcus sp. P1Y]